MNKQEESESVNQGATNLTRLLNTLVGYLRREEGVPFARGALVRGELYQYFLRRRQGKLKPQPSMLEQAMHPHKELPKPPRPAHPLCPERVTLEVHLTDLMGLMNGMYHPAAALFVAMPAWLRFLESLRLIDAGTSRKVAAELSPLHDSLTQAWEQFTEDPLLYREGQAWLGGRRQE